MKMFALLFSSLLTFSTLAVEAPWSIAVIDTAICPTPKLKNIVSHQAAVPTACKHATRFDRSIHGQFVIDTFRRALPKDTALTIHHYNVFDEHGNQNLDLLKKALDSIKALSPQLTLMAMGHVGDFDQLPSQLPSISFVATGTVGPGIEKTSRLWPHELKDPQLVLVGHFTPSRYGHLALRQGQIGGHLDSALLYRDKLRYLVAQAPNKYTFGGSSMAVAKAAAKAIIQCGPSIKERNIEKLHSCLRSANPVFVEKDAPFYTVLQI